MIRIAIGTCCLLWTVTLLGCKSSDNKDRNLFGRNRPFFGKKNPPVAKNRPPEPPSAEGVTGVLAGRIIDEYDRPASGAEIRIVAVNAPVTGAAPIDYEETADEQGYFSVTNLKPGQMYQVIVKSEQGGRTFSDAKFARPPDPRLLIRLKEVEGGGTGISPVESREPYPEKPREPATSSIERPIQFRNPIRNVEVQPEAKDRGIGGPPEPPARGAPVIEGTPRFESTIDIPGDRRSPYPPVPKTSRRSVVPSCERSKFGLTSFALKDLNGGAYSFPRDSRGDLILLDFWFSSCYACHLAIPKLNQLQREFGSRGLEVLGIACERGPFDERESTAREAAGRHRLSYRTLMSGHGRDGEDCPLTSQLQVRRYPTLILMDRAGNILWRSEGLGQARYQELRSTIMRRLR